MRRLALLVACLLACGAAPARAEAHAFGALSISVYSGLVVSADEIQIRWVLDMAEIPASATVVLIDTDKDGTVTEDEKSAYFDLWVGSVLDQIRLVVDGHDLSKEIVDRELTLPAGEGGRLALRLVMDLVATVPEGGSVRKASYRDANYLEYIGWREVAVAAGPGAQLIESTVPTEGRTNELTIYPPDLGLSVPTSEAEFSFAAAQSVPSGEQTALTGGRQSDSGGFQVWPTGVLAAVLLAGLVALMVAVNRPGRRARR